MEWSVLRYVNWLKILWKQYSPLPEQDKRIQGGLCPWSLWHGFRAYPFVFGGFCLVLSRSTESHIWNLAVSASSCHAGVVCYERVANWDLLSSHRRYRNPSIACWAHEEMCGGVGLEIHFCRTLEWDCGEQLALITSGSCLTLSTGGKALHYLCSSSSSSSLHLIFF